MGRPWQAEAEEGEWPVEEEEGGDGGEEEEEEDGEQAAALPPWMSEAKGWLPLKLGIRRRVTLPGR